MDSHGDALAVDMQRFYGINIDDTSQWSGPWLRHVFRLLRGLGDEPWSRLRSELLDEHPPAPSREPPSWLGWTPERDSVIALDSDLRQLMAGLGGKRRAKKFLPTPADRKRTIRSKSVDDFIHRLDSMGIPHVG